MEIIHMCGADKSNDHTVKWQLHLAGLSPLQHNTHKRNRGYYSRSLYRLAIISDYTPVN